MIPLIQANFNLSDPKEESVNGEHVLPVAAPHSSSWLSVVPSPGLGLHLESNEYQMAIKWWLGLDTSGRFTCPFCPDTALDPLGHHAVTCRHGGDVVIRHNCLRDDIFDLCRHAHLSVRLEKGNGLTRDLDTPDQLTFSLPDGTEANLLHLTSPSHHPSAWPS